MMCARHVRQLATKTMAPPQIYPIMGTMTIGSDAQLKQEAATELMKAFAKSDLTKVPAYGNKSMVDTARVYQQAFGDGGDSESTIRNIIAATPELQGQIHLATKAISQVPPHFSLSRDSLMAQSEVSMQRLGTDCIDLYYLHMPDVKTDLNDTLRGIKELHEQGKIKEFGLSNFPAWLVVDIWYRCKALGMVQPTVYQGMYNILTRSLEPELVAVCREFNIRLYAYNPLAGGILSGRYTTIEDMKTATEGRFSSEFDNAFSKQVKAGALYQMRYAHQQIFDGINTIKKAMDEVNADKPADEKLTMVDVALRWMLFHSYLTKGDGIILGFSKVQQLEQNLAAWQGGPLPQSVVDACDVAWQLSMTASESYFKNMGTKPGSIDTFLALKAQQQQEKQE
eukprot:CAMPEP_0206483208 /NCGR_PEP_ID=MMETSP0324_2-20121206/39295_1 /ASSEMBLY_ACC=CAM_ASM_000836 /TAXON_ID=2866 /ORGANISM="Crypthecodinium cohnii, Strain Seligo" /LENGTH=395 /DNA_ID=CAMNT_0053961227 /DNA_START=82 /DNA_END=1269 /DNA_ORIENTATION=+